MTFSFKKVWNEVISQKDERPSEVRERIYASELGWSMVDTYLKMKGTPPTNPANERSQRKFWAGNFHEEMVAWILKCAGYKFRRQDRMVKTFEGCLPISGKVDFIIEKGRGEKNIPADMPDFLKRLAMALAEMPDAEEDTILEIKTLAGRVFDMVEEKGNAHLHHMKQTWVYRNCAQMPAVIVYMSRDDERILEFSIDHLDEQLESLVHREVHELTTYYRSNILPPKEKLINFEDGRFKKNLKVEYSGYLSMLYSRTVEGEIKEFEGPVEYRKWAEKKTASYNRVVKRLVTGAKVTEKNKDALREIERLGYNLEEVKAAALANVKTSPKETEATEEDDE